MNYRAIVLIVAVAIGSMGTANAQFLKKLGKKVEKAAERTVERRAERETEKKTDKALDKILEPGADKGKKDKDAKGKATAKGNEGADEDDTTLAKRQATLAAMLGGGSMEEVPDTYTFSYRATMEITNENEKDKANLLYWLEPEATYFGTEMLTDGASGQVAVMDMDIESMVMFMDNGDRKTAMRLNGSQQLMDQFMKKAAEDDDEEVQITPIAGKTILGYGCKGFQMESEDGISKIWVTDEAPVGMVSMMKADYLPEGLPDFGSKALFMEMEYVPKNKKEGGMRMVCTELKPASKAIHKKDYQSMGIGGN